MKSFNKDLVPYWEGLKQGRDMPSEDDLDPDVMGKMWRDSFLMQFRDFDNVVDYNYSYLGQSIIDMYGENGIHVRVPGVVAMEATHLEAQYMDVRRTKKPLIYEGERALPNGLIFSYRQCLFPLSYDGTQVHSILGRLQYSLGEEYDM